MGLLPEGFADLITWEDSNGIKHVLNADIVVTADDTRSGSLTVHPVENGSDVADHYVHDPDRIMIQIAQTQTPILEDDKFSYQQRVIDFPPSKARGIVANVVGVVGRQFGAGPKDTAIVTVLATDSDIDRVAEIHDQLIDVKQNVYPITIAFKGREYPNFVVTSIKLSHPQNQVGLGRFELQAQQFTTVATATATLPDPATLHAKPNKDGGKKPTKPADADDLTSVGKSITNSLGVTTGGSGL